MLLDKIYQIKKIITEIYFVKLFCFKIKKIVFYGLN